MQPVVLCSEGTPFPEVPRARGGAEGRLGVAAPAELGVGAWRPRYPRRWASVRVAWSGLCPREDAADARVQAPALPGSLRTMGSILSRRIAGVEDIDIQANSAYRYPPKSGERPARPRARGRARPGAQRGVGRARPRGAPRRRAVGSTGPAAVPTPHRPGLRATSTQTVGGAPGSRVPAPSPPPRLLRRGDLGSVASPLCSSAPWSAHRGD